jgi:hypothetical protein
MNQLLIVLCLIAGTWYLVSANLKNDQDGIPLSEVSAPAPTSVEQYKTDPTSSEQLKLQPINPVAEQSGHAIVPDQSPAALVAGSESPSQPAQFPQPEIGPTPGDRLQVKSEASIRSGPSASAQVIGTAHAGAKLQVQSRDAEWVQLIPRQTTPAGFRWHFLVPWMIASMFQRLFPKHSKNRTPQSFGTQNESLKRPHNTNRYAHLGGTPSFPAIKSSDHRGKAGFLACF